MILGNSIKNRLIFFLSIILTTTLLIIAFISSAISHHEADHLFDSGLVRTAKLLLSLTKHEVIEHESQDNFIIDLGFADDRFFHKFENRIHFQIWIKDILIYNSSHEINNKKPEKEGFGEYWFENEKWRSFSIYDNESDLTIEVMESDAVRNILSQKILITIFLPLLFSFIPIIIIIWIIVKKGLIELTLFSNKIRNINPNSLKTFSDTDNLSVEIKPLIDSLNFLISKLDESMNKERSFINFASHELRTPLAVIKTKTQFLIKKYSENEEYKNDLESLLEAADRIINLANQLLILSRIDSDDRLDEKEDLRLAEIIRDIVAKNYQAARKKDIDIKTSLIDCCKIDANKFHIEILINNLIENAIKYSPNKEKIFVNLKKEGEKSIFEVINKGRDIKDDEIDKIFDRFYRIERDGVGSGLGLSIVKKISEIYNIEVKITSKNKLNTFKIVF